MGGWARAASFFGSRVRAGTNSGTTKTAGAPPKAKAAGGQQQPSSSSNPPPVPVAVKRLPTPAPTRASQLLAVLSTPVVDRKELALLVFSGVPDCNHSRWVRRSPLALGSILHCSIACFFLSLTRRSEGVALVPLCYLFLHVRGVCDSLLFCPGAIRYMYAHAHTNTQAAE